jgi:hypothetical protein
MERYTEQQVIYYTGIYSINQCLKQFFFMAELISVQPELQEEDLVITRSQIEKALNGKP